MRKCISLGLIVGLLIVSGVPLVSAADICGMDGGEKHAALAMSHSESDQASSQPGMLIHDGQHGMVMDLPADTCRLECACGCHSSIDSLPHLLAPHTVPLCACDTLPTEHAAVAALPLTEFAAHTLAVSTPPPRKG